MEENNLASMQRTNIHFSVRELSTVSLVSGTLGSKVNTLFSLAQRNGDTIPRIVLANSNMMLEFVSKIDHHISLLVALTNAPLLLSQSN